MLISDDLPTLDRPINAYSGLSGLGQRSTLGLLMTNVADLISIWNEYEVLILYLLQLRE